MEKSLNYVFEMFLQKGKEVLIGEQSAPTTTLIQVNFTGLSEEEGQIHETLMVQPCDLVAPPT